MRRRSRKPRTRRIIPLRSFARAALRGASQPAGPPVSSAGRAGFDAPPSGENGIERFTTLVAAGLLLAWPVLAHTPQQPPHQLYAEGDLNLESGEAIRDFAISYVT